MEEIYKTIKYTDTYSVSSFGNVKNNKRGIILNDNRVSNLEWATNRKNQIHSYKVLKNRKFEGINNSHAKLTEEDVLHIKNSKKLLKELSSQFHVTMTTQISRIRNNQAWSHF